MIRLFSGSGLRDFARQQGLLAVGPQDEEHEAERSDDTTSKAVTFRRRLVAMGPAYVKLGQVLSTRADLLPAEFVRELEQLQDDVPQIPFADVV